MAYIAGPDRTQAVLLPEVLDDDIGVDNPVRFLDVFVAPRRELGLATHLHHTRPDSSVQAHEHQTRR